MSIRKLLATLAVGAVAVSLISATPATAQSPASVAAGFQPLALFDDYITGSLRAQGPWSVNTPGAADGAFAHADVPAVFSGKALAMLHGGENPAVQYRGNAYAALGALSLPAASTGTVFFELLAADALVFAVPLYNFGVSQHFKAYVDLVITDPRMAPGQTPPTAGKAAVLATVRGGA
jgi:hypothetical protein